MSGGIAYIWDPKGEFPMNCNLGMVELEKVESAEEVSELLEMVEKHEEYTGSTIATALLDDWTASLNEFVKVMPTDYKRVLFERQVHEVEG
jgi:glutamate synthase domain-containing protein 3